MVDVVAVTQQQRKLWVDGLQQVVMLVMLMMLMLMIVVMVMVMVMAITPHSNQLLAAAIKFRGVESSAVADDSDSDHQEEERRPRRATFDITCIGYHSCGVICMK